MDISANIKRRRLELGISQQELADKVGYKSRTAITKIETGKNEIPLAKLLQFAEALDTSVDSLLSGLNDRIKEERKITDKKSLNNETHCVAIILAGGKSTRNMQNIPSQFLDVNGKPIINYSLEVYERHPLIDSIYVVCLKGWNDIVDAYASRASITKLRRIVPAGSTGLSSIKNAFDCIRLDGFSERDIAVIQETTRPMVTEEIVSKVINSCAESGSAVIGEYLTDQLIFEAHGPNKTYIDRHATFSMQSPDAHRISVLSTMFKNAAKRNIPLEDNCCGLLLYKLQMPFNFCEGTRNNIKIVRQEDVTIFKALSKQ